MSLKDRLVNINNPNKGYKKRPGDEVEAKMKAQVQRKKFITAKSKSTTIVSGNQSIKGADDLLAIAETIEWGHESETGSSGKLKNSETSIIKSPRKRSPIRRSISPKKSAKI
jgi:hypothetical protein